MGNTGIHRAWPEFPGGIVRSLRKDKDDDEWKGYSHHASSTSPSSLQQIKVREIRTMNPMYTLRSMLGKKRATLRVKILADTNPPVTVFDGVVREGTLHTVAEAAAAGVNNQTDPHSFTIKFLGNYKVVQYGAGIIFGEASTLRSLITDAVYPSGGFSNGSGPAQ